MKRVAVGLVLLAVLGGGVSALAGPFMAGYWNKSVGCTHGGCRTYTAVPDAIGPWGQPVPMAAPYSARPPDGSAAARAMLAQSLPLDIVQQTGLHPGGGIPGAHGPAVTISPPGVPAMPNVPATPRQPAAAPNSNGIQLTGGPPGAVAAVGALTGGGAGGHFPSVRSEVRFVGPPGMKISWYGPSPAGGTGFTTNSIEAPGRYNFVQAAIYRLKLSDIPNRPGLELYPTLEVVPANKHTATFLAHSAVPVLFTEEDFHQVASGNFVVKVIYLPDPRYQDLATIGAEEVVSSRLEPGVDPIAEACRRGSILVVVRLGNIDLEAPNTPAMDAPSPYMHLPKHAAGPQPGRMPGPMAPPGTMSAGPGGVMSPGMPMPPGGGMAPMPPGGMMPPQMRTLPGIPTNQPQPPQPPAGPSGPVGQLPDASEIQVIRYTKPAGKAPAPAETAGPEAGTAAPAEKKSASPLHRLLDWGSKACGH